MSAVFSGHRPYTRAEYVSDAVVHVVGLVLALIAIPALILLAALIEPSAEKLWGVSVYAASMLAMPGCSAATCWPRASAFTVMADMARRSRRWG